MPPIGGTLRRQPTQPRSRPSAGPPATEPRGPAGAHTGAGPRPPPAPQSGSPDRPRTGTAAAPQGAPRADPTARAGGATGPGAAPRGTRRRSRRPARPGPAPTSPGRAPVPRLRARRPATGDRGPNTVIMPAVAGAPGVALSPTAAQPGEGDAGHRTGGEGGSVRRGVPGRPGCGCPGWIRGR